MKAHENVRTGLCERSIRFLEIQVIASYLYPAKHRGLGDQTEDSYTSVFASFGYRNKRMEIGGLGRRKLVHDKACDKVTAESRGRAGFVTRRVDVTLTSFRIQSPRDGDFVVILRLRSSPAFTDE